MMPVTGEKTAVHANVYAALAAAQAEMGKALKSSSNPHFRSKYADLGAVMDACLPALNSHGIAVFQPALTIGDDRYIRTVLAHGESGTTIECDVPLIVSKNDMQGYGSAVTYARRYGLMAMAGIAPEDDDGNAAASAAPKQASRQAAPASTGPTAMDVACDSLGKAATMEQLQAVFSGLPISVRGDPRVVAAKDAAKARLSSGLVDDEIPY
ncbi:ERF family protein [Ketogulonicigenium robustum]|uniref:ERF family protein n=2 Tax=Ketogulonicigenium robustum TaxID=92947 RepID=A0A1W6NYT4_9RHOB|nr:ERF family protein [Ketogulonicigenium robustum]